MDINCSTTDAEKMKAWVQQVMEQMRCKLGVHKPLTPHQVRPFTSFYGGPECGGYKAFTPTAVVKMLKSFLSRQFAVLVSMQEAFTKEGPEGWVKRVALMRQREQVMAIQDCYESVSREPFRHEIECTRDTNHCNSRRICEGSNHTHGIIVTPPSIDLSEYNSLVALVEECMSLGLDPVTGPVTGMDHRAKLLREKLAAHHKRQELAAAARRSMQRRDAARPWVAHELWTAGETQLAETLRIAIEGDDMARVVTLVQRGAPPNLENRWGMFPLLAAGLARDTGRAHTRSPRCLPPSLSKYTKSRRCCAGAIAALAQAGANPDHVNWLGMSALMWAARRGDLVTVNALLEAGATPAAQGGAFGTALHAAARANRAAAVEAMCEHVTRAAGAAPGHAAVAVARLLNVRATAAGGVTALMVAARRRNEGMARLLLRRGADLGIRDHHGFTAADHAAAAKHDKLARWLRDTRACGDGGIYTYADLQAERAIAAAEGELAQAIAQGGGGSGGGSSGGRSSMDALPRTVRVLAEGHAPPDLETDEGQTALMAACYGGSAAAVEALLSQGCDACYVNRNGRTPLMAAAARGHVAVVERLLSAGARADDLDVRGYNAARFAHEAGHGDVAKLVAVAAVRGAEAVLGAPVAHCEGGEEDTGSARAVVTAALDPSNDAMVDLIQHVWVHQQQAQRARHERQQQQRRQQQQELALIDAAQEHPRMSTAGAAAAAAAAAAAVRCPKCTLPLPCHHYLNTHEVEHDAAALAKPPRRHRHSKGKDEHDARQQDWGELYSSYRARGRAAASAAAAHTLTVTVSDSPLLT
ncbi:ankyrin repeat-containing domain protein [Tribonema minus]|uniref:Ankyrin repeat-containing domain protein n=1 Tax=Tribonema minus TaxID=303371 RepID=A0A836C9T3_9STRA|nr:ankyrin repeat-containing domain protein [Tribonema minus]